MAMSQIVLPITEPETEWVRGRPLQKVSPTRDHAILQRVVATALATWAGKSGDVGTEWRFRPAPPGQPARPLVPDVSYVSVERLRGLTGKDLAVPLLSPDIAVEILSPDDRRADVDDKIATYLAAGSQLVLIVDPKMRAVELHDAAARTVLQCGQFVTHPLLQGFNLSITELFDEIEPPR